MQLPLARILRLFFQWYPGFGVHKNAPEGSVVFVEIPAGVRGPLHGS